MIACNMYSELDEHTISTWIRINLLQKKKRSRWDVGQGQKKSRMGSSYTKHRTQRCEYGRQYREEVQLLYKTRGRRGWGETLTIQRGKAEAIQNKRTESNLDRRQYSEEAQRLYKIRWQRRGMAADNTAMTGRYFQNKWDNDGVEYTKEGHRLYKTERHRGVWLDVNTEIPGRGNIKQRP